MKQLLRYAVCYFEDKPNQIQMLLTYKQDLET
jgi:hypothetical protein